MAGAMIAEIAGIGGGEHDSAYSDSCSVDVCQHAGYGRLYCERKIRVARWSRYFRIDHCPLGGSLCH